MKYPEQTDDQAGAETIADAAHAGATAAFLQDGLYVGSRRTHRRCEAKEHRAHERDEQSVKSKAAGITPMTSYGRPFIRTSRPITRGSEPKQRIHSR